jgi:hypothetical protein
MPENIAQQDAFSEKTKLLNIALKHTGGDMERAKFMVSGQYNDVKIIKVKFDIDEINIYGIVLIFINLPNRYIMHLDAILMSVDNIIARASIFDSWKTFYSDMINFAKKEDKIIVPSFNLTNHLIESFKNYDIYTNLESDNLEDLTDIMTDILRKFYSIGRVNCQLNIDNSNSLTLELSKIPIEDTNKVTNNENAGKVESEFAAKIEEIESKANILLNARIIISPIKGKHISNVQIGEKIKVILTGNDQVNKEIAKKLNVLTEDNQILPINMRVTEKFPMEKKGYYIYGLIAKNVLVRVIEEEDIKIEIDAIQKPQKAAKDNIKKRDNRTILYIVLLTGLLFIILFIIFILI